MVAIFDFDGVINTSDNFSDLYAQEVGIPQEKLSRFFRLEFNRCARGEADIKQLLEPHLESWKWTGSVNSLLKYWFEKDIKLNQELLMFISQLSGRKFMVVLASQQERNRKNYIWETLGLKNIFDKFFCTCDLGLLKSDSRFYEMILEDLTQHHKIKFAAGSGFFLMTLTTLYKRPPVPELLVIRSTATNRYSLNFSSG